jgi:TorA maturation chaperone TorD
MDVTPAASTQAASTQATSTQATSTQTNTLGIPDELEQIARSAEWFAHMLDYPTPASVRAAERDLPDGQEPHPVSPWLDGAADLEAQRDPVQYSGLFDIGSPEPPVSLLESSHHPDGQLRQRRVVNFYREYGVRHDSRFAPDHLAVELAYIAYLARLAAQYPSRPDLVAALRAFARLHPGSYVHACLGALHEADTQGIYRALFVGLARFLADVGGGTRIVLQAGTSTDRSATGLTMR